MMDDLISRKAAIDVVGGSFFTVYTPSEREDEIRKLPSAVLPIKEKCMICPHCYACDVNEDGTIEQKELKSSDWKTDHGYMWLCPECGLTVHSDFDKCVRCGNKRPPVEQSGVTYISKGNLMFPKPKWC